MPIEFSYAQARAQARHGARLSVDDWSLLESSKGLSYYLQAARSTALAVWIQPLSAASSPHQIEFTLRQAWRGEVETARRWSPKAWQESIAWTVWLPYLPAIAHLRSGVAAVPWMTNDPMLSPFLDDHGSGVLQFAGADVDPLQEWLSSWQALWPKSRSGHPSLQKLVQQLRRTLASQAAIDTSDAVGLQESLECRIARLMRMRCQQSVTVFYHLTLVALQLWRLRSGLIRRSLFNSAASDEFK